MITIKNDSFSIAQICESGQCFRMNRLDDGSYSVIAGSHYVRVKQREQDITFFCTRKEFNAIWVDYFDLKTDYGYYLDAAGRMDGYLSRAARYGSGIRILRQDLWEMIISFIISQQNNIKRIRKCIELLCREYGEEKSTPDGGVYYAFPKPEVLAAADGEALKKCNTGYRARYIKSTAMSICRGDIALHELIKMPYPEAKAELLKLCGVGSKVADCICLFSLHQLEAFPVDTHIRQALDAQFPDGFPYEAYPGFAGVIQQYIFFYELQSSGRKKFSPEEGFHR